MTIATDLDGNRVWSRMDNYQFGEAEVGSSANEYVFTLNSGGVGIINDEGFGIGIASLDPYSFDNCTYTYSSLSAVRLASIAASAMTVVFASM